MLLGFLLPLSFRETMGAPPQLAALLSSGTGRQSSTSATQSDQAPLSVRGEQALDRGVTPPR